MWETLIDEYWHKFRSYKIKVSEPNITPYVIGFEEMYQKMADKNNRESIQYHWNLPKDTAESLFDEFIDRITIKILEEDYVLKYMTMRVLTYFLYDYYENPGPMNPHFDIYDKDNNSICSIPANMWRWWVDEMGY